MNPTVTLLASMTGRSCASRKRTVRVTGCPMSRLSLVISRRECLATGGPDAARMGAGAVVFGGSGAIGWSQPVNPRNEAAAIEARKALQFMGPVRLRLSPHVASDVPV